VRYKILEGWEYERLSNSGLLLFVSSVICTVFGHVWRDVMYVKGEHGDKVCEQCYRCWETQNYDNDVIDAAVSDLQEDK